MNHLDSSSNPSSTTSSTPSSPVPFPTSSNPPSTTTPANPSPSQQEGRFSFPAHLGACPWAPQRCSRLMPTYLESQLFVEAGLNDQPKADMLEDYGAEAEEPEANKSEAEDNEDEVDDLPSPRRPWRGPISHKASQTSVYLQEWDISFEQVELGEPIGQGRWGRVHCGCWHGEVAIRLLEMHHHNQDHLKLFKKEVMNYWQMWHENVVLFMGACMNPPTWPSSPAAGILRPLLLTALCLAGRLTPTRACQLPSEWRPLSEGCRAELAETIVYAKVLALHREVRGLYNYLPWHYEPSEAGLLYSTEVEMLCDQAWGSMLEVPTGSRLTFMGLGYFWCHSHAVVQDYSYFFFLRMDENYNLLPHGVNFQDAIFPDTQENRNTSLPVEIRSSLMTGGAKRGVPSPWLLEEPEETRGLGVDGIRQQQQQIIQ
ncbi:Coiled-coil domain-containing protein 3, partial [Manis javanica]